MSYLRRQIVTAALAANAVRPSRNPQLSIPTFAAGWLTTELAPHLIALTATDTAVQVARGKGSKVGRALALASMAGLGYTLYESTRVRNVVETALIEGLGLDYIEQLDAAPTPAELATPWRKLVNPFRMRDERVTVTRDIPFTEYGARGHLDIYQGVDGPKSGAPVLLQVHGGGWTIGRKDQQGIPLMQHLAAKGWVCVSINYRLAPRDAFPAQIIDVKSAIAWIKEHIAEYGGDPGYLAITGGSAGGHLSALAALTPNDPAYQPGFEDADTTVNVAVPHYGVYDFAGVTGLPEAELMRDRFLSTRIVQRPWQDAREVYEAATPILRVTPDAPDFFVIHGRTDTLVPVGHARHFVAKLREESKRSVVYAELPGAQHAFDTFPSIRSAHVVRAVDRYLHWHWNTTRATAETRAVSPVIR